MVDMHVVVEGPKKHTLNLITKMCSYGRFQNDEILCGHGMTVLRYRRLYETNFYSSFYTLNFFKNAYDVPVNLSLVKEYMRYNKLYFRV